MGDVTTQWDTERAATELLRAEDTRTHRGLLSAEWPDLDPDTAYRIQDRTLTARLQRGEKIVGIKLGLTSRAKQERMNVDQPLVAWLTDAMMLTACEPIPRDRLIRPRVEPEIVLVLGRRLRGPDVTRETAMAAVATVHGGLEVIDSRYADYQFTFPDVIADNASSGAFVTGSVVLRPGDLDLAAEACELRVDGALVDSATGAAVLGHPGEALALAANILARRGLALDSGWIVLTGGLTDAVPAEPGVRVTATFAHLGSVELDGGGADAAR